MTSHRAALVLFAFAACRSPDDGEIRPGPAGAPMEIVHATTFTMGTADAHPDLPKAPPGATPLSPWEVLVARADPAWRVADERPAHEVRLRAFAIDRTEVTNAQYRRFLAEGAPGHRFCHRDEPAGKDHVPRYARAFNPLLADPAYARTAPFSASTFTGDEQPAVGVDWFDAYAFAAWAGKRLPTEAEWELACRGQEGRRWPWGDGARWGAANVGGERRGADVPAKGHEKDGFIYPAPVGSFPAGRSPFGCDDLAGNAAEWVSDAYDPEFYAHSPAFDPKGPDHGSLRVVRGGSSQSAISQVRCAARAAREPAFRTFTLGFRCAKDL